MTELVEKLSNLLTEARELIEELSPGTTSVGNIGCNMAKPSKTTNQDSDKKSLKYPNLKDLLKRSIKNKKLGKY